MSSRHRTSTNAERRKAARKAAQPGFRIPRWWLWRAGAGLVAAILVAVAASQLPRDSSSGGQTASSAAEGNGAELSQIRTNDFHSMAVSPLDPSLMLYGHHGGVLRSTDGGRTWQTTNLTGGMDDAMGMAFAGPEGSTVYAAGHDTFFKSTDAGANWARLKPQLPGTDIHGMAVAPDNAERLYANVVRFGFYRSDDGGETWQKVNTGALPGDVMNVSASSAGTVYVASMGEGVLRSDDAGLTFRSTGKLRGGVLTVAAGASEPTVVYAGTDSGFFASTDGGASWTERTPAGGGEAMVSAVSPTDPRDVTVMMVRDDRAGHVFRSHDGGVTWTNDEP